MAPILTLGMDELGETSQRFMTGSDEEDGNFYIRWAGIYGMVGSDFSNSQQSHWSDFRTESTIDHTRLYHIVIRLDCLDIEYRGETKYYRLSAFVDGEKLFSGCFGADDWDKYRDKELNDAKFYMIGKSHGGSPSHSFGLSTTYGGLAISAVRLYNRALSDSEVLDNYNKTVTYYETIIK